MYNLDYNFVSQEQGVIIRYLQGLIGGAPKLQEGYPNINVKIAVHTLLQQSNFEGRNCGLYYGEFVSRILRLPDVWRNCLLEYVNQTKPYDRNDLSLKVSVLNTGNSSLRILVNKVEVPQQDHGTGQVSDAWTVIPSHKVLEPKESIDLPASTTATRLSQTRPGDPNHRKRRLDRRAQQGLPKLVQR